MDALDRLFVSKRKVSILCNDYANGSPSLNVTFSFIPTVIVLSPIKKLLSAGANVAPYSTEKYFPLHVNETGYAASELAKALVEVFEGMGLEVDAKATIYPNGDYVQIPLSEVIHENL